MVTKLVLAGFTLVAILGSCETRSLTDKTIAVRAALQNSLQAFDMERRETQQTLAEGDNVIKQLPQADTLEKLATASEQWEETVGELSARIQTLEARFREVGEKGNALIKEIDIETSGMQNPTLKSVAQQRNQIARAKWEAEFAVANERIAKLRALALDGSDVGRMIRTSILRSQIVRSADELKEIARQADQTLADVNRVTEEGNSLLNLGKN